MTGFDRIDHIPRFLINPNLDEKTLSRMHRLYCRKFHGEERTKSHLCKSCQALLEYSLERTGHCGRKKQGRLCSYCKVHCFEDTRRVEIKTIMRYAGKRLILTNPVLAMRYLLLKKLQHRIP